MVSWFGAVQAQDYPGSRWALGLRARRLTDDAVVRAFESGRILRTHALRQTWHFVTPRDIRWILALSSPRVHATVASYFRKFELDGPTLSKTRRVLQRALQGGTHLTRTELSAALGRAGIVATSIRLGMLMMHAELEGVICSGPRRGSQFTYALLDERVPSFPALDRDEALAELTSRYFTSHGPATVRDFVWWSGMTVRDARAGLDMIASRVASERVGERTYYFVPRRASRRAPANLYLLSNYDEYLIAYRDRGDPTGRSSKPGPIAFDAYGHYLVVDGVFAGTWRRSERSGTTHIRLACQRALSRAHARTLDEAVGRFAAFVGGPVKVER